MSTQPQRVAFSYVRFSTVEQERGGSVARQTRLSEEWAKRRNVPLDNNLKLHDLGVSAFRGDNVRDGALAGFLEACRSGRVPRDSYLIVESLDRLSRDDIRPALQLLFALQDFGITIVTMQPEREYPHDSKDALGLIEPLIIFARAHEESEMKSHRRRDGWRQAKDRARAGGGPIMKTCPAWLEVTPNGFLVKEEAAATVRKIYDMARDGLGVHRIAERLTREGVLPIGKGSRWVKAYVYLILSSPAAMGTYQPQRQETKEEQEERKGKKNKKSVPDGEPIPGHYPPIVTAEEWREAQDAIEGRSLGRGAGRKGVEESNLFTGLLRCATSGEKLNIVHAMGRKLKGWTKRKRYVYLCETQETGAPSGGRIDYGVFEKAVLSFLKELHPSDILPTPEHGVDRGGEVARLSGRLLEKTNERERVVQRGRTTGRSEAFLDIILEIDDEVKQITGRLRELNREEKDREPADLGEAHSLITLLADAPPGQLEDLRRRLKGRIKQLLSGVWMVIVRRGKTCLCAVQLWFRGGERRRDYLIVHKPGTRYTDSRVSCRSLASDAEPGGLDLRERSHAARLALALEKIPLE